MNFSTGDIVLSKAGRDKNKHFIVVEIVDENFVMIADGDLRKVDNLKCKKCKHLENTGNKSEFIKNKIGEGVRVTNPDLKKELAAYNEKDV